MCAAPTSISPIQSSLAALHERYQQAYEAAGLTPQTEYIDEWDAPCYAGELRFGMIPWRAVPQRPPLDFTGIEQGLESQLHEQVKAFYEMFYAADLHLSFDGHPVTLSQILCTEDGDRLARNLIAHVLMKRKLQQGITLFIGTSEESEDLIISVDNLSGEVGLEYAGKPQHEVLAPDLATFLDRAQPRVVSPE